MKIRIPLKSVFIRHIRTYGTGGKTLVSSIAIRMLLCPLVVSFLLCFVLRMEINLLAANTLITVMAIFIPLLFTALISLHDTRQNIRSRIDLHPSETTKLEYLLEKYETLADNVSFILASSIVELVFLLFSICIPNSSLFSSSTLISWLVLSTFSTFVIYFLLVILCHIVFVVERLSSLVKVTAK